MTKAAVRRLFCRLVLSAAVLWLFSVACETPAFWARGGFFEGGTELVGAQLVLAGWLPPFTFPWLANLLLFDCLRRLWGRGGRIIIIEASLAVGLGLLPLAGPFLLGSGMRLLPGYFLWEACLLLGLAAALLGGPPQPHARVAPPFPDLPADALKKFQGPGGPPDTVTRLDSTTDQRS